MHTVVIILLLLLLLPLHYYYCHYYTTTTYTTTTTNNNNNVENLSTATKNICYMHGKLFLTTRFGLNEPSSGNT